MHCILLSSRGDPSILSHLLASGAWREKLRRLLPQRRFLARDGLHGFSMLVLACLRILGRIAGQIQCVCPVQSRRNKECQMKMFESAGSKLRRALRHIRLAVAIVYVIY